MSGSHRRVIPREELSTFQLWQFNSLLDTPAAVDAPALIQEEIESVNSDHAPVPSAEGEFDDDALPLEDQPESQPVTESVVPYPTAEEIEAIQQQAHDEGFQAGLESGRLAAEAEVLQLQTLLGNLTETLQVADRQLAESVSRLYLSPEDLELLQSALQIELPSDVWRLLPDPNMLSGSCKIETPATQLSFTLASRWESILRVLNRSHHPDLAWGQYPEIGVDEAPSASVIDVEPNIVTTTPVDVPVSPVLAATDHDAID